MSLNSRNTPESILFLERLPNQAQTTQKFEAKVQEMSKGKRLSRGSPFYSSHLNFCVIIAFVPTRAVIKGYGGAIVSHQKNSRSNLIILTCIKMLEIPRHTLKLNKDADQSSVFGSQRPWELDLVPSWGPRWDHVGAISGS